MKRVWALALALVMLLASVSALAEGKGAEITAKEGFPIVSEEITLSVFGEQGALHGNWADSVMFQKYQEMTGIKLDFRTALQDGFAENKALVFVDSDLPDIFLRAKLSNSEIGKYADMLMPLEDLLAEYAPNYYQFVKEYPAVEAAITSADGHIYALSNIFTLEAALGAQ